MYNESWFMDIFWKARTVYNFADHRAYLLMIVGAGWDKMSSREENLGLPQAVSRVSVAAFWPYQMLGDELIEIFFIIFAYRHF